MLCGLWSDSDADASDEDGAVEDVATESDAAVELAGTAVLCRVSSYHPFNANRVWPGTYSFADWLAERWDDMPLGGRVLELGAATGALSAWLTLRGKTWRAEVQVKPVVGVGRLFGVRDFRSQGFFVH